MKIGTDISIAIEALSADGVVAIPTETVYGLAGNAFSQTAIDLIYATKKRPKYNPLIVHIKDVAYLDQIAENIPNKAYQLAQEFWPGSLTLVLEKKNNIPDVVTAGKNTVGIRVPNHPLTLKLLAALDFPLAAPSANPFGYISPTSVRHVEKMLAGQVSYILDGGDCTTGVESTIIGFENNEPILYRHGAIPLEEIEKRIGKIKIVNKENNTPSAPGMLSQHYSPTTPFVLVEDVNAAIKKYEGKTIGVLVLKSNTELAGKHLILELSKSANLEEAASKLFAAMHQLDDANLDVIIAQRMPNSGLGVAINDRLERAAKK